jgi:hypothetical protein
VLSIGNDYRTKGKLDSGIIMSKRVTADMPSEEMEIKAAIEKMLVDVQTSPAGSQRHALDALPQCLSWTLNRGADDAGRYSHNALESEFLNERALTVCAPF